jgi:hypothetical protein
MNDENIKIPVITALKCFERMCKSGDGTELDNIALVALREKAEREDPKPLSIDEIKDLVGKPVWWAYKKEWRIIEEVSDVDELSSEIYFDNGDFIDTEKGVPALYKYELKEAHSGI